MEGDTLKIVKLNVYCSFFIYKFSRQGYAYKVITKLAGLENDPDVKYKSREEQVLLLQQVMAATDAEVGEEEVLVGAGGGTRK